jgi:hypothetical protein
MSAAGARSERVASDNYPTPAWCTRRIIEAIAPQTSTLKPLHGALCVEPCAGEGAISKVLREYGALSVVEFDVRRVGSCYEHDATQPLEGALRREWNTAVSTDLLITNPPFSLAADIITAQRDTARVCAYLLRSSFKLEGTKANGEAYSFRGDMPSIYLLPERPSFIASDRCVGGPIPDGGGGIIHAIACGWAQKVPLSVERPSACPECGANVRRSTSDASEYAWFVWSSDRRSVGEVRLLPRTPLAERRAA